MKSKHILNIVIAAVAVTCLCSIVSASTNPKMIYKDSSYAHSYNVKSLVDNTMDSSCAKSIVSGCFSESTDCKPAFETESYMHKEIYGLTSCIDNLPILIGYYCSERTISDSQVLSSLKC